MHIEFLPPPKEGDLRTYLTVLSLHLQQLANTVEALEQHQKEEKQYGK